MELSPLLWAGCLSFVSGSLASLISNCSNLSFFYKRGLGSTGGLLYPGGPRQVLWDFSVFVSVVGTYWVLAASLPVPCGHLSIWPWAQPCPRVRKLKGRGLQPLPPPLPSQPSPLGLTVVPGRRTWNRPAALRPCSHWRLGFSHVSPLSGRKPTSRGKPHSVGFGGRASFKNTQVAFLL